MGVIYRPEVCDPPRRQRQVNWNRWEPTQHPALPVGTIWECDRCGQWWEARGSTFWTEAHWRKVPASRSSRREIRERAIRRALA